MTYAESTKEQYHGAIQRKVNRFVDALLFTPSVSHPVPRQDVVIRGRSKHDTKRAILRYWSQNEARLGVELEEFQRHCTWREDGTVVYRR